MLVLRRISNHQNTQHERDQDTPKRDWGWKFQLGISERIRSFGWEAREGSERKWEPVRENAVS